MTLYKVDGTLFTIQPTAGQWLPRQVVGDDGNGRPIYSGVREFRVQWKLVNAAEINQLQTFFDGVGSTGTSVIALPQYASSTYGFFDYTGCVLREPVWGTFYAEHTTEVVLMVTKIRT